MKVTSSNQTLILASERNPIRRGPVALDQILSLPNPEGLQRITIVASRPDDSHVYVQADYAPVDTASVAASGASADALPIALAKAPMAPRSAGSQGRSRGIALYASTQAISNAAPVTMRIDVHA